MFVSPTPRPARFSSGQKLALVMGGATFLLASCCAGLGIGSVGGGSDEAAPAPRETVTETITVTVTPSPVPTTEPPATVQPFAGVPSSKPAAKPVVPKPAAKKPVTPKRAPAPKPPSSYYANCTAARAAGVTPLHAGDPGYRRGLDRDGDGVACE